MHASANPRTSAVPFFSKSVVRATGALLLLASVLKLTWSDEAAVTRSTLLKRSEVMGALISTELALGLWFASGIGARAARWAALLLFTVFAMASGAAGLAGHASCGCLGAAQVSPWILLGVDLLVVVLLVILPFGGPWQSSDRMAARVVLGTAGMAVLGIGTALLWFGSWAVTVAVLKNHRMAIDRIVDIVGECQGGVPVATTVTFTNLSDEPIQIILVESNCDCVTADVPIWIGPRESRVVQIEVRPPKATGPFVRKIAWRTTAGLWLGELRGVVVDSSP